MSRSISSSTGRTGRYVRQPSALRGTPRSGQSVRTAIPAERKADIPRLFAAAPILAVCTELEQHVDDLRRLAPASDATTALTLYRDKLSAALSSAREIELFISADQAAVILGKSVSMVTYLCRNGSLQAKKIGGMWQIYREDLERIQRGE
jgi:hypothetical protein